MQENQNNWEKRWHPLREEWVIYAAHRNKRPWSFDIKKNEKKILSYDPNCYLCPTNKRNSGQENPDYEEVFVFENDYPVVGLNAPEIPVNQEDKHQGLYQTQSAKGIAKVICYTKEHNLSLAEVSLQRMTEVLEVWQKEMQFFARDKTIHSVLIFENRGELVGVSNPHPHCQIYAVDFPLKLIETEQKAADKYHQKYQQNLFAAIIKAEQKDKLRMIVENEYAIAFIPFFARYAYEVLVFPKKRHATLITCSKAELQGLAAVYQEVIQRYDKLFDSPFPYVMNVHQAPVNGEIYANYHCYIHFQPPLRQPGLSKYLAGPEIGAGNFMADTMPEVKAAEMRNIVL